MASYGKVHGKLNSICGTCMPLNKCGSVYKWENGDRKINAKKLCNYIIITHDYSFSSVGLPVNTLLPKFLG